jgi:hypothetical protein
VAKGNVVRLKKFFLMSLMLHTCFIKTYFLSLWSKMYTFRYIHNASNELISFKKVILVTWLRFL